MEEGFGRNSVPPPGSIDKSKILDIKPIRCLIPVFSKNPQAPYSGEYPAGFSPFFPFGGPQETSTTGVKPRGRAMPTPIRSFRSPVGEDEDLNGNDGYSHKRNAPPNTSRVKLQKIKPNHNFHADLSGLVGIGAAQKNDGNREVVNIVLMSFDALRRRLSQLVDANDVDMGMFKRTDLKAGNICMSKGIRTNATKRIGSVPGVEIGDIFFFRMEMCVVGLHAQSMGGIDAIKSDHENETLAVSIVSSGEYDDDEAEDGDVLIYTGQGENFNKKEKHLSDQKLHRGNLALDRSSRQHNEVRVIRGIKDTTSVGSKIYVYDGLYKIQDSWAEKAKSGGGGGLFKYKLIRVPGQPSAFSVWRSIQKWKSGILARSGLILPDLSSGAESIPVSLVNEIDNVKSPAFFTYFQSLRHPKSFSLTQPSHGCSCSAKKACIPGDLDCSCIQRNEGDFPYIIHGVLVSRKPLVHECGPTCKCYPNCKNRVSQSGLKHQMEVFKTKDKGWGLRSWDPIRAGAFICEYAGEVIDKARLTQLIQEGDADEYVFDTTRVYESFKWNYEPKLLDEVRTNESSEDYAMPHPLIINAKNVGNVARFMNHSCSPNVFWQPVLYEENNQSFLHVAFFALRHIPPMQELTYDYGADRSDNAEGSSAHKGRKRCFCGSVKCRGSFT
ncbi:histone-lysine N-methyltransferase, H3 lysine-9 specific SUVH1-like [Vicia villosa]|uniref:histone-lysine N-methyltransferase, H3 lysine-9 specific SUVH1-like n=1 Tax=Vicia villosa TaxID=3911 RepID=UPI00273B5C57|nr:histone-lysine N-methyltransferase, H3 lysine-9 specific SUVH1-like [Vicia villosa]XP_058722109.1 histone-lysine N-methyltransferase, H3 lysine-9 specific SUVH1-like [Vicia villosa]